LIGVAIAAACSSFSSNDAPSDAGIATDGGNGGGDANADGGVPETCTEEEKKTPKHCGRCGRDCGYGLCVDGECTAYKIVDNAQSWYVAVDETNVYWTSPDPGTRKIMRAPKTGGTGVDVRTAIDAFDIAPLGSALFFTVVSGTTAEGTFRGTLDGQGAPPEKIADGGIEIAALGTKVYGLHVTTANQLFAVEATGAPTTLGGAFGTVNDAVEGIATDGEYAYLTKHLPAPDGVVFRRPLGDGPPYLPIAEGVASPRRISVDDQFVYWTGNATTGGGGVFRAPKAGGEQPKQLLKGEVGYGRVIVSGDRAYVTIEQESKVVRMNKDGSNPADAARDLNRPIGLAQDDKAIYFGENDPGGAIWRMVK
jgi:hypothetical protein